MNWEAIAAVSELVAAIAVVISLINIAVQVRSGASAFRTSIRDTSFHALMEFNYALTESARSSSSSSASALP
jgi:hypothetical protein